MIGPMSSRLRSENHPARLAVVALGSAVVLNLCGCYQRVTRASGPGTDHIEVYQRSDEGSIFDGIFGPDKPKDPYGRDSK